MTRVGPQEPNNLKPAKENAAEKVATHKGAKASMKKATSRAKAPAHAYSKEAAQMSGANFMNNRLGKVSSKSLSAGTLEGLGALAMDTDFLKLLEEANPVMAYESLEQNEMFQPQNLMKALGLA